MSHSVDLTVSILDDPSFIGKDHIDNVGWICSILIISDPDFSGWCNGKLKTFFGFGLINIRYPPPLDVSIGTCCDVIVFILE
jgi:hypothetical protein